MTQAARASSRLEKSPIASAALPGLRSRRRRPHKSAAHVRLRPRDRALSRQRGRNLRAHHFLPALRQLLPRRELCGNAGAQGGNSRGGVSPIDIGITALSRLRFQELRHSYQRTHSAGRGSRIPPSRRAPRSAASERACGHHSFDARAARSGFGQCARSGEPPAQRVRTPGLGSD